jgi:flavodoxin
MRTLLVLVSFHHHNTEKVANAMAEILDAEVRPPKEVEPEKLAAYDLVGFGSGIYGGKHHGSLLRLADKLPQVVDRRAFLFSTSIDSRTDETHAPLRERLTARGYEVLGDFNCRGFNTNSFLKFFGGIARGRPNDEDLEHAREFAQQMQRAATGPGGDGNL